MFVVRQGEIKERFDVEYFNSLRDFSIEKYEILGDIVEIKWWKRIPLWMSFSNDFVWYKYLRVEDIKEGVFNYEGLKNINEEVYNQIKNYYIDKGNLCISIAWTIGKSCVIEKDYNKKLILTENCAKLMIRDTTKILPKFLEIILNLDIVQKQFNANFSQATIAKLSIERLRQIKIPVLPPLEVQNQIVAKMDKALAIKKQKEQEAKVLLESIDDFMLDELGIEYKEVKEEKIFGLKLSELGEMKRFDVENYKGVPKFSSKYACAKIRDIATINPARKKPSFKEDETVPYVWLPETDDWKIKKVIYRPYKEVAGRNIIKKWDILFARIEPSIFNKKYIYVDETLKDEFAYTSTEFYIIEAKEGVNHKYIFYMLFQDSIYSQFSGKTTWSTGRRRLDKTIFEQTQIPLPPLEVQNKIVAKIDEIIIMKRRKEQEAREIYEKARCEVEEMILGK